MMKVNFLKRLESSIEAFEISMHRTIEKITRLEEKIYEYKNLATINEIFELSAFMPDEIETEEDEEIAQWQENWDEVGKKLRYKLADMNLDDWLEDLQEDKKALTNLHDVAKAVTKERDLKLRILKEMISQKIKHPINPNNRKVLIFTAFADTACYLYDCLKDWVAEDLGLHIALVTGGNKENRSTFRPKGFQGQSDFNAILTNFSPISKQRAKMRHMPQEGEIDILIATDCISEGQNLQDCDYLINYDIHWNPVRIIQRFGRIDRLGNRNGQIQLVNFWPTEDLNNYINLKDRVEARMALVDLTATGDDNLLDSEQIKNLVKDELKYRDRQLLRLKEEVLDLEDMGENVSLTEFTLDDFRIELMNFIQKNKQRLEEAPFGLYSVVPASEAGLAQNKPEHCQEPKRASPTALIRPGVIFCLRQKGETSGNEQVNPLQPYFLVYIYDDGAVRFNYTNAKQILEIFRSLCQGRNKPCQKLCDLFNEETDQGRKMEAYNALMQKTVAEIARIFKHRSARALIAGRDALLIPENKQASAADDFELITWLIIK
jgi:superfamily II DNA/RNA helicase